MDEADAVGQSPSQKVVQTDQVRSQGSVRFSEISEGTEEPTTEKGRIEKRLKSFVTWKGSVLPLQLAVAGFIYTGEIDTVLCIVCGLRVYNWRRDLKPLNVHRKYSPDCSFLKQWFATDSSSTGNQTKQEVKTNGYDASKAKYQTYVEFVKRLTSFTGWPHKLEIQSPQRMAMAGFFYLGSADRARCFYCGLVLRDWDTDDVPVSAHKQWSPNCAYIKHIADGELTKKGKVIDLSSHLLKQSAPQHNATSFQKPNDVKSDSSAAVSPAESSSETKTTPVPGSVPHWSHSPAVQALLDWGYSLDRIQEAIRRHKQRTGKDVNNATELLCAVEEEEIL